MQAQGHDPDLKDANGCGRGWSGKVKTKCRQKEQGRGRIRWLLYLEPLLQDN